MVERMSVEHDTVVRFHLSGPIMPHSSSDRTPPSQGENASLILVWGTNSLPFRLTAGLWPLTPAIVVRIHEGQPIHIYSITLYGGLI